MSEGCIEAVYALSNRTFASLRVRNYRLYFGAQAVSISGTFMQQVAQAWLVLQLSHSGITLGLVVALQFVPILLFAPMGGVIADRFPKRRLLYITQTTFGLLALGLGVLVATHQVQLWMMYWFALAFGFVNSVDNPTRQTFVVEMVGRKQLRNAVTLNSSLANLARIIGPAIGGIIIAAVGLAPCFIINGASYIVVVVGLSLMRRRELHSGEVVPRTKGQVLAGFRYVLTTPILREAVIMMLIVGTFTYEFQVSLPLLARFGLHDGAATYAALTSAMGVGAVVGGLVSASRRSISVRLLTTIAGWFALAMMLLAAAPTLPLALVAMLLVGFASINFTSTANATLQLNTDPVMRGRVMSLWTIAFLGSTAIGGPIIGWVSARSNPRWGLLLGGVAALVAAVYGRIATGRSAASAAVSATGSGSPQEPVGVTEEEHQAA